MKRNSVSPKKNHDLPQMIKGSPFTKRNVKEERSHFNVRALAFKVMRSSITAIILIVFVVRSMNMSSRTEQRDRLLRSSINVSFKTSTHEEQSDHRQLPPKNHPIISSLQQNHTRSIRKKLTKTQNIVDQIIPAKDHNLSFSIYAPIIHIVNTRFQQNDKNLNALGAARLELFETFCLPSMVHQTIQPSISSLSASQKPQLAYRFIWIIKVDPHLDPMLKNKMADLLRSYPNFFLVGSNTNFNGAGSWRSGEAGNDLYQNDMTASTAISPIYTGDTSILNLAHAYRNDRIVLETRLDADDGLPLRYLEDIQHSAVKHLSCTGDAKKRKENKQAKWMYWCMPRAFNWHSNALMTTSTSIDDTGRLSLESNRGQLFCLTPGLTSGISVGVNANELPTYGHHKLMAQLKMKINKFKPRNKCGKKPCLHVLTNVFPIRARTPTSAGMMNVITGVKDVQYNDTLTWQNMLETFAIQKERVKLANLYLRNNLISIAKDNLKGQCSPGHSCKNSSKFLLNFILNSAKS